MTQRRIWAFLLAMAAVLVIAGPPFVRTVAIVSTGDGLTALAMQSDEERSFNPWSEDCFLIGPDTAVEILRRFDWPYENRKNLLGFSQPMPLLHQSVGGRALGDDEVNDRLLELTRVFLERGESPEDTYDGYTVLHVAVLWGDLPSVRLLVEAGSSLDARIDRPERSHNGMDAQQFAELMMSKVDPSIADDYEQVLGYLTGVDVSNVSGAQSPSAAN